MGLLLDSITEWLKGMLIDGIMNNLSGMFDAVNRQVADVATRVGSSPANFSPGVFALVRNISESVIIPIAGMFLTFVACYELIQLIIEHNNLANFETWIFFKWIFKTFSLYIALQSYRLIILRFYSILPTEFIRCHFKYAMESLDKIRRRVVSDKPRYY